MRGLIGYPLGHSYSKIIQESINHKTYDLIPLKEDEFNAFMKSKNYECLNVTIPYKQRVQAYMDEISDEALRIGAINCIVNKNGKCKGYNSDYYGLKWMLERHQFNLQDKTVAILGSGGTSKTSKAVVEDMGAKKIVIVSRRKTSETITYDELYELDPEVIINTTPVGMYPDNDGCVIDLDKFTQLESVIDVVYNPLNTRLVFEAKKRNIKATAALEMLVGQAIKAIEYFDDVKINPSVIDECMNMLLKEKQNIVLIGMPSSGKTTISKLLKEKTDLSLKDTDELIVEKIQMPISDYFAKYGEKAFRDVETEVIKSLRNEHHCIISCGGGVIKKEENMRYLKENGCVFFIDRDLDKLISTNDRPLSNDREKLQKLYEERYNLYIKYSDIIIKNNDDIQNAANEILEKSGY